MHVSMSKYLLLILIMSCTSGCSILSYQKCSNVQGHPAKTAEMTLERISTVEHNGCTLTIHYRPHRNKSLLIGPIIPFIPTFGRMGYDLGSGERYIRIVNEGESGTAIIKRISAQDTEIDCSISTAAFYHEKKQYRFSETPDSLLELTPNESILILLPNRKTITISVEVNAEIEDLKIEDVLRLNYHMITA